MATNQEVIDEHIRALLGHDLDALIDGYADDAVMIVGPEPIVGQDAIRAMFSNLPDGLPDEIAIDSVVSHGEYSLVTYHHDPSPSRASGMRGGDTFHISDGKILLQTAHFVETT
jgi:ketosteroid isomerase-like protein